MNERIAINIKLKKYIEHVINHFNFAFKENYNRKPIYELKSKKQRIIEAVDELEGGEIYLELFEACFDWWDSEYCFLKDSTERGDEEFWVIAEPGEMSFLLRTFLRRSFVYIKAFNNEEIIIDQIINEFNEAFLMNEINVRYIAPIEFVEFNANNPINFGIFSIRKFSIEELEKLSHNDINEIFFPDRVWDIKTLANYWFIDVTKVKIMTYSVLRGESHFYWNRRELSTMLGPIQDVINNLILINWNIDLRQYYFEKIPCQGFNIPFMIRIDEYPLLYPDYPDVTMLKPVRDYDGRHKPIIYYRLDKKDTKVFIKQVNEMLKIYDNKVFDSWSFMKIAFTYLQKALFAYEDSNVIERFLFYNMVIEALLGEKKDSLMNLMANRLGRILGENNDKKRKAIRSQFRMIYDTRSKLIHGDNCTNEDIINNLDLARVLAQKTCIWFLNYLNKILNKNKGGELPEREDILRVIDLEIGKRKSITQLSKLTEKHFKNFPYIKIS